jgi:UDP-N-acetylglucosamine--N-acetylmuramyl-(pentapeptide) pyrophosphoryl-undecaprenol N-acetylglucosamine transferase
MPLALQAATLVVCRSGAATLSELAALSKPAILVPLPPALGGSPQEANAAMFGQKKAAEVIRDTDLSPEILAQRVQECINAPEHLQTMAQAAGSMAKPEATREIVQAIASLARTAETTTEQHRSVVF